MCKTQFAKELDKLTFPGLQGGPLVHTIAAKAVCLKEAAERAKCELSSTNETTINLPFIAADASGPKHFNRSLSREKFEELVGDLVRQTVEPCENALRDAKLQPEDIDKVILVGGQTRSPIVERTVEASLQNKNVQ